MLDVKTASEPPWLARRQRPLTDVRAIDATKVQRGARAALDSCRAWPLLATGNAAAMAVATARATQLRKKTTSARASSCIQMRKLMHVMSTAMPYRIEPALDRSLVRLGLVGLALSMGLLAVILAVPSEGMVWASVGFLALGLVRAGTALPAGRDFYEQLGDAEA